MSGGGGSSAPTTQTVQQVTIPPELMPYAQRTLGTAEQLAFNQPYQSYGGQRFAGLNPLQMQGFQGVGQLGVTPQTSDASNMAADVGNRAGQMAGSYNPAAYQGLDVNYMGVQNNQFGLGSMQPYMSPYMKDVVEQQKQGAIQDYRRQIPGIGAAAARMGGRGGTREALLQSEANRNLNQQLQGIEASGTQQAFQQGMQQYNVDQAQRMQAQLANQQAQLQAQGQALGQRQFANQFGEQSRQFGANLGLQGLQQQLAAAGQLGQLGQQEFGQRQQASQNQLQAGSQLQMQEQQRLQAAYDDFLARQRYPYTQLGFMSDLIRGTPTAGGIQTMYQAPPNAFGQIAGAGLGLAGLYGAMR